MKNRFLLLMLFLMTSVASWGYAVGDIITPMNAEAKGFTFEVVDKDRHYVRPYTCEGTGDIVIPASVTDSINTVFRVTETGAHSSMYRYVTGSITISEGIETVTADCFNYTYAKALHIPSTLTKYNDYRTVEWVNNFEEVTVAAGNTKFATDADHTMLYDIADYDSKGTRRLILVTKYKKNGDGTKSNVTEINVPEGVTQIWTMCISSNLLEVVNLPKTVNTIISNFFYTATKLRELNVDSENPYLMSIDGVVYEKNGVSDPIKLIRVPSGKYNNENPKLTIKDGVTEIADNACRGCSSLVELDLNDVVTIGVSAFQGCSKLKNVMIGKDVSSIGDASFSSCTSLESIDVDDGSDNSNKFFSSNGGILYNDDFTTLMLCPGAKTGEYTTMPSSVTTISGSAFYGCNKLTKIVIAENVESIPTNCFYSCTQLRDIIFTGNKISSIGNNAFYQCTSLNPITIPASVESIGSNAFFAATFESITFEEGSHLNKLVSSAFSNLKNVESITLPKSLTTIGENAFGPSFKTITFENNSNLNTLAQNAFKSATNLETVDFGTGGTAFKTIGERCFWGLEKLTTVSIPASVTTISSSAFNGCTALKNVTFETGSQLTTLGGNVFQNTGLEEITLPDNLVTLSDEAFTNCNKLKTVHIPATTKTIGATAFKFCSGLTNIDVDENNTWYATSDGMLCNKAKTTLISFPAGKARNTFTLLSPSFTEIGDKAFYYCKKLTNITIPKKVTRIGNEAFYLCDNLNSITFFTDEPVENLGTNVFGTANTDAGGNLVTVDGPTFLKNNVTINIRKNGHESEYSAAESVWKDCRKAYSFNSGVNEFLPMSATTVNLLNCTSSDNSVVIPASVTNTETSKDYSVGMISDYAFESIPSTVKEVIFRGPVEYVGSCAFYNKTTGTSPIENIFFVDNSVGTNELSTARFGLTDEYKEFLSTQKIYVTRSMESNYKSNWPDFADQITYEIPTTDIMPNAECGSFAREFAVDLSNNGANSVNSPQFIAFVPMRLNSHDEDGETVYTVRMQSINEGGAGDGTYIPAGTGVVLRKYGSSQPTYYEIAESQTNDNNAMSPAVICNSGQIPASTSTLWNYYIGKNDGLAHKATKLTNIGVHKSYLSIPVAAGAKAVTFSFSDIEDNATGVSQTKHESAEDGEWYTVTGQKTRRPSAGLFIRNGKKFIVK